MYKYKSYMLLMKIDHVYYLKIELSTAKVEKNPVLRTLKFAQALFFFVNQKLIKQILMENFTYNKKEN